MAMSESTPRTAAPKLSAPQKALHKMGLIRPVDLALHLPYRYEDETRLVKLRDVRDGETAQIEGVVQRCEVIRGQRRQLVAVIHDGQDSCTLRFFHFYASLQNSLQEIGRAHV